MKTVFWILLFAIGIGLHQLPTANAGLLSALVGSNTIYNFDSATPGTGTALAVTGLGGDALVGIDYRPLTGELYGLGGSSVYTINPSTGSATIVGTGFGLSSGTNLFGFDFNPMIDRIRVVDETDRNLVVNPITGALQLNATPVFYNAGDSNFGANPRVVHHAYNNNSFGTPLPATSQLFAIDVDLNVLVRQANNAGTLDTVGSLGVDAQDFGGFDIDGNGTAFAAFNDGFAANSTLYNIDLITGAATPIGTIPGQVRGLSAAAVPEPSSLALLGLMVAGAAIRVRQLKLRKQAC